MNLKTTKAQLINDIRMLAYSYQSGTVMGYTEKENLIKSVDEAIGKAVDQKLMLFCQRLADTLDKHIYSTEEQEKDLGL
jgi:hypothetical protein